MFFLGYKTSISGVFDLKNYWALTEFRYDMGHVH